jgi:hypothetical protein
LFFIRDQMHVVIGNSTAVQAFQAGVQAVSAALKDLPTQLTPRLALAFCSGDLDAHGFYAGIRQLLGEWVPVVGGSAMGLCWAQQCVTEGPCAAVVILAGDDWEWQLATSQDIYRDPHLSGEVLAGQLPSLPDSRCLLLLFDSVRFAATAQQPPILIPSGPIISGVHHPRLKHLPLFGAGLLGDCNFNLTWQFSGDGVSRHSASALQLAGQFQVASCIMHGCVPLSDRRFTVTDVFGQYLYQLDQEPIVPLLDRLTGSKEWRHLRHSPSGAPLPVTTLALARPLGDDSDEQQLVTRLMTGVMPGDDAVMLFEADFFKGQQVMLMRRDPQLMMQSAHDNTTRLLAQIKQDGQQGRLALYFDCGGRMSAISGSDGEEAEIVRDLCVAAGIPFLAIYTGVEIAPLQGASYGLDWSGVLVILTQ